MARANNNEDENETSAPRTTAPTARPAQHDRPDNPTHSLRFDGTHLASAFWARTYRRCGGRSRPQHHLTVDSVDRENACPQEVPSDQPVDQRLRSTSSQTTSNPANNAPMMSIRSKFNE